MISPRNKIVLQLSEFQDLKQRSQEMSPHDEDKHSTNNSSESREHDKIKISRLADCNGK